MPSQFSLLNRKQFVTGTDYTWISEPMNWGGYQRAEVFLSTYTMGLQSGGTNTLIFEGANEPGYNATWTTIAAGTPADPATTLAVGVKRFVRDATLYPFVRIKLIMTAASGLQCMECSLDGSLFEQSS